MDKRFRDCESYKRVEKAVRGNKNCKIGALDFFVSKIVVTLNCLNFKNDRNMEEESRNIETRTLKELLQVMIDNERCYIDSQCNGLCWYICVLNLHGVMSIDEHFLLKEYIETHRPEILTRHYSLWCHNSLFYWPKKKWAPRLKWLRTQIKKLP